MGLIFLFLLSAFSQTCFSMSRSELTKCRDWNFPKEKAAPQKRLDSPSRSTAPSDIEDDSELLEAITPDTPQQAPEQKAPKKRHHKHRSKKHTE